MQVTFYVPEELIQSLGMDVQALSRAALEALVLEGVRSDALSTGQARRILGIRTRERMDAFLKAHGIDLPLTIEQVRRDSEIALSFSE
jgi:DNA-binding LacI/PurR family transcriptional regulator